MKLKAISAADSSFLLKVKDSLPQRTVIAIHGTVTAVSEIIKINKDCVFMIELDRLTHVVVKQPHFHHWHAQLKIGTSYFITNLRPTTLSKSHHMPARVYVPWTGSEMLDGGCDQFDTVSLEDWLGSQGLSLPSDVRNEKPLPLDSSLADDRIPDSVVSYKGIITDTSQAEDKIYMVDNSVRLFLCFLPEIKGKQLESLQTGDTIALHNTHQRICPLTGKKWLFPCVRSSLCVERKESSQNIQSEVLKHVSTSGPSLPLCLLSKLTFSATEVEPLIRLHKALMAILPGSASSDRKEQSKNFKVRDVLERLTGPVICPEHKRRERNHILEFCCHDSCCALVCDEEENTSKIPELQTVKDFCSGILRGTASGQGAAGRSGKTDTSSGKDIWDFGTRTVNEQDRLPLVGWLDVNSTTGHLQLANTAEAVDIVMTVPSAAQPHRCCSKCEFKNVEPGGRFSCPYIHPDCLGHLIAVTQYLIVRESFSVLQPFKLSEAEGTDAKTRCYVLCATRDCVLLQRSTNKTAIINPLSQGGPCGPWPTGASRTERVNGPQDKDTLTTETSSKRRANTHIHKETSPVSFVLITSKHFPRIQHLKNRETRLQFSVEGQLFIARKPQTDDSKAVPGQAERQTEQKEKFSALPQSCGDPSEKQPHSQVKKKWQSEESEHEGSAMTSIRRQSDEETSVRGEITFRRRSSDRLAKKQCMGVSSSQTDTPACEIQNSSAPAFQKDKVITLKFHGSNCRWYDVIHPPGIYAFSMDSSETEIEPLVWPALERRLQRAITVASTRTSVDVADGAKIDRVYQDVEGMDMDHCQEAALLDVAQALSERHGNNLVSFRGEIVWRHHPCQMTEFRTVGELARNCREQNTGGTLASFLGDCNVCVGVKDLKNCDITTSVYFSTQTMAYPLGLLPGVTVEFHRLEKKISKAEKTYFTFLPVSSMQIVSTSNRPEYSTASGEEQRQRERRITPSTSIAPEAHWDEATTVFLINQWTDVNPPEQFVAQGHICQFYRISLKSVCTKCHAVFLLSGCSAPACSNMEQSSLSARFSVLVEDGSCQALVSVNDRSNPHLPRRLLTLSETEWHGLEKAVQKQGELFIQDFGSHGNTSVEEFMLQLCDSVMVKRPCLMMLCKPPSYKQPGSDDERSAAIDCLTLNDLKLRKINTGETRVETLCLPHLQLNCMDLREI